MLLRIIDEVKSARIKLEFTCDSEKKEYFSEPYDSPFSYNFRKDLTWYFSDYPKLSCNNDDRNVVEKTIKFGQYLGDYLAGEDQQLLSWVHSIEQVGYEHLQVKIESPRISFFNEIWELLVLPDSKFMLSACVKSFIRVLVMENSTNNINEKHSNKKEIDYQLHVTSPISKALEENTVEQADIDSSKENTPLKILHIIGRNNALNYESNAYSTAIKLLTNEGAIDYHVNHIETYSQLPKLLKDKAIHIAHIDCPVQINEKDGNIKFIFSNKDDDNITLSNLIKLLLEYKIYVLSVDARYFSFNNNGEFTPYNQQIGLAEVAKQASSLGLKNVIGLSQTTDSWVSNRCFSALYQGLTKGFSLSTSIIESRKQLQQEVESSRFSTPSYPFHFWSLLTHYGDQDINFFTTPQFSSSIEESHKKAKELQKLFGFHHSFFPKDENVINDKIIFEAKREIQDGQIVAILGEEGTGKTHDTHQLGFYLAQSSEIEYGFYFDFNKEFYTKEVILEMIGSALEQNPKDKNKIFETLKTITCYFVLDNFFNSKNKNAENIYNFIYDLNKQQHYIIATGHEIPNENKINFHCLNTKHFDKDESIVLVTSYEKQNNLKTKQSSIDKEKIIKLTKGNPFLIKQYVNHITDKAETTIDDELCDFGNNSKPITNYFEHQFRSLPALWKVMLIQSVKVGDLLWEIFMIATNNTSKDDPWTSLATLLSSENKININFNEGLTLLLKKGFIEANNQGRSIGYHAKNFLLEQTNTELLSLANRKDVELVYSQLLCRGIGFLCQHILKQQNPMLSHHLLINRRFFVEHFERLWFNKKYDDFYFVKHNFDQILLQAKLNNESAEWSLDLLNRSVCPSELSDSKFIEDKIAWLHLAHSGMQAQNIERNENLIKSADYWRTWLIPNGFYNDTNQFKLFHYAVNFLEKFYLHLKNWKSCLEVMSIAQGVYKTKESWQWYIQSLKTSCICYSQTAENDKVLETERVLLEEVPYETSPSGFEQQQILAVIIARTNRGDFHNAQIILDKLQLKEGSTGLNHTLNLIQADLYLQRKNYEGALKKYCELWEHTLKMGQKEQLAKLKEKILEIKPSINIKKYDNIVQNRLKIDI